MNSEGEFSDSAVFERAPGCAVSQVDDGYVICGANGDKVHFLNMTGALVYELCDGAASVKQLAHFIDEEFALQTSCLSDVGDCVTALAREGLLLQCG